MAARDRTISYPVKVYVYGSEARRFYRSLRMAGFQRDAANWMAAGFVFGTGAGQIQVVST